MSSKTHEDLRLRLAALDSMTESQRAAVLIEVGWERLGQPTPGLLPFLEDPALLVRISAAQARWQTAGNPEELDRLVGILVEGLCSEDEDLALAAGTALVQMEEPAVAPLIHSFQTSGENETRIVRVLGEIGGPEAVKFLEEAARSDHSEVAEEAREALLELAEEMEGA
ncbi:MAG: hypothetical protein K0U98_25255 [Deltaproteobacteria bacterium]|nr:hypothetical protein [Deltaproteobacteria bacterium]